MPCISRAGGWQPVQGRALVVEAVPVERPDRVGDVGDALFLVGVGLHDRQRGAWVCQRTTSTFRSGR